MLKITIEKSDLAKQLQSEREKKEILVEALEQILMVGSITEYARAQDALMKVGYSINQKKWAG